MSPMNAERRRRTAADLERLAVIRAKKREAEGIAPEVIQAKLQAAVDIAEALRQGHEYPGLVVEITSAIHAARELGDAS